MTALSIRRNEVDFTAFHDARERHQNHLPIAAFERQFKWAEINRFPFFWAAKLQFVEPLLGIVLGFFPTQLLICVRLIP